MTAIAANPVAAGGATRLPVTVSIGVATATEPGRSFDALLKRADVALYEAKAGGRNRVIAAS